METSISSRLKAARQSSGFTQQQLGIALGLEPNAASARMNQYEKGKHAPDYLTMKRIAKELDVPVAYFYCEDDILAELICLLDKINEEEQALLIKALRDSCKKSPPVAL